MNPEIQARFDSYPIAAKQQLERVRALILAIAAEYKLGNVEETLKWAEASYSVKGGSPIRIDWKAKEPSAIKVFFHCQTRLVATFREIYRDEFVYEGNRAVVIPLDSDIEQVPLRHCLLLALQYQRLKHLPLLGA
ncbi:DUF1801 domain-containing protein [Pseudomonas sp.]|uniref:DUF1801 domain-containing protein n=1 Tax=Pseudomonas sp. TaxID=306 RepID=UPI0027329093|nr:DUF1801 domain-containing protein [Pseudomonas sp.]MDP2748042.1 DUF1801 domain-containing protein [Pseudomonas sp.]